MEKKPLIWILGEKNSRADESFSWNEEIPLLSDPDILIVPISSLTSKDIEYLDFDGLESVRDKIFGKFISGGKIIFILGYEFDYTPPQEQKSPNEYTIMSDLTVYKANYSISPIEFDLKKISNVKYWKYDENDFFSSYLKNVKTVNLIITSHGLSRSLVNIEPFNPLMKNVLELLRQKSDKLDLVSFPLLYDKSNNILSEKYWLKIDGFWSSGELVYLPPISNGSFSESIDMLLRIYHR